MLANTCFGEIDKDGFHVPLPQEDGWEGGDAWGMRGLFAEALRKSENGQTLTYQVYCQELDSFVQSIDDANRYYDSLRFENERNVIIGSVNIGGWIARIVTFSYDKQDSSFAAHAGILLYAREMRLLQVRLYSEGGDGQEYLTPQVMMDDLELVAEKIRFVSEEAPIRHSDVELTIGVEGDVPVVAAGGTLQLNAVFGNAAIVNSSRGNDSVIWEVMDSNTGLNTSDATVSNKGLLTVGKNVQWATEVVVRVTSEEYGTSAVRKILLTPAASGLTAEPDALTFYAGENRTETVKVMIEPEIVPRVGLTWSMSQKDILEITDHGNGTASVRPLMPGKGTLTIREPGGKTATVKITVMQPVLSLELTSKGKPRPGNTMSFSVKLTPYNAGDRTVEWSVDVDESIASINNRGKLKINKETPAGTVIHVTCTANGAPEPVKVSAEVVVAEK